MADLSELVLQHVDKEGEITTDELAKRLQKDHQKIVGAVKSLQSLGNVSYMAEIECIVLKLH